MSPAPIERLKADAPPIPNSSAIAIHVIDNGNDILVAAFPSEPTDCPIKNWSTILYNAVTSIAIMLGTENFTKSLFIGSTSNGFLFSVLLILSLISVRILGK